MSRLKFRAWNEDLKLMSKPFTLNCGVITFEKVKDEPVGTTIKSLGNEVVEQWTGLTDKNGVEIFEGDIVKVLYTDWISKCDSDKRTLDEYLDSLCKTGCVYYEFNQYKLQFNNEFQTLGSICHGKHGFIKVIGNIHENPELLEQQS